MSEPLQALPRLLEVPVLGICTLSADEGYL